MSAPTESAVFVPSFFAPFVPAPRDRDALFDNARLALILLVVVGHAIEPVRALHPALGAVYRWIYAFHMPAFVLIAGHFMARTRPSFLKLGTRTLLPLWVCQILYGLQESTPLQFHTPYWVLWFLLSLFTWGLMLPLFLRLPLPAAGALAGGLALAAGTVPEIGQELSLSRTLVFFPFFLLGAWVRREHLEGLRRRAVRIAAVGLLAAAGWGAWALTPELAVGWFYGRQPYAELRASALGGTFIRASLLGAGFLLTAAFLALVPRRRFSLTGLGARTIYAYLLHGLILRYLTSVGLFRQVNTVWEVALLVGVAAVGSLLLMSPAIVWLTGPLVEPARFATRACSRLGFRGFRRIGSVDSADV